MQTQGKMWARLVIVAYKSGAVLQDCLDCLALQTDTDFEVVIVNNFIGDDSVDALHLPDPSRFHIVHSPKNSGFSGGTNLGAKGAHTQWVFSLNPDAHVTPNWLAEMKRAAKENPQFAMLSPMLVSASDENILDGCGDVLSNLGFVWRGGQGQSVDNAPQSICRVFAPCGACAGYKREVFEAFGGFDESFFCYLEDVDLGLRLNIMGERCLFVPSAKVRHVGSETLGEGHPLILHYSHRNMILMMVKNFPIINLLAALPLHIAAVFWISLRNWGAKRNRIVLKGMAAGLAQIPKSLKCRFQRQGLPRRPRRPAFYPLNCNLKDMKSKKIFTWPLR